MVELKNEEGSCDVKIWEWLLQLIKYLGADSMSSEESGVEVNDEGIVEKVYRGKKCLGEETSPRNSQLSTKRVFKTKTCTRRLGKSLFRESTVSRTEPAAINHYAICPGPFIMIRGSIASTPISVTARCEYPKNNSIGLSTLQSKDDERDNVDIM